MSPPMPVNTPKMPKTQRKAQSPPTSGQQAAQQLLQDLPDADPLLLGVHRTFTHVHGQAQAHLSEFYKQAGLSIPRFNLLRLLHHAPAGRLTMRELSACLRVSPPNVTKLVDGLEREGWLVRSAVPDDRRSTHIHLSPRGQRDFVALLPRVVDAWADMWSCLNDDEKGALTQLLEKFGERFG